MMTWTLVSQPDLSEQQFGQWRELLRERAGVRLNENQKQFLQSQVTMRMREVGEQDIASYFSHISDASEGRLEWSILIDRLVVKETSFFSPSAITKLCVRSPAKQNCAAEYCRQL